MCVMSLCCISLQVQEGGALQKMVVSLIPCVSEREYVCCILF